MRFYLLLAGLLFFASCVPNKRIAYLQKDDVNKSDLPKDTVVRSYQVNEYDYKIQPEDIISVQFESLTPKDLDFLNQSAATNIGDASTAGALMLGELVDQKGEIPVLFLGNVEVAGLTVFQVQEKLQKAVAVYLDSPVVKVRLLNFRFTILGQVTREGTIVVTNNRVTLLEAIGLSGGLGEMADRANIKLVRHINGKTTIQYINLLDENFIKSPYYYLHQNDVLIVPALKQRPFRSYFGQNLALVVSTLSLIVLTINLTRN